MQTLFYSQAVFQSELLFWLSRNDAKKRRVDNASKMNKQSDKETVLCGAFLLKFDF